ncbi:MAG: thiamine-phosphate kinase, partial [Candidatus Omnitrophota bacterium]
MKIKKIGEFGLIGRMAARIKTDASVLRGIGDDAAVVRWTKDKHLLFTSDMLVEGRHFKKSAPPYDVGRKALACGISDIAAMGGIPKWALVSCCLSEKTGLRYADGLFSGIKKMADSFGVNIIGGDTVSSDRVVIDIALAGEVKKKNLTLRSAAREGDFIFVTGSLGGSISGRHLHFTPRLKEAQALIRHFKINSMIDISDGLSSDLLHITGASNAGAVIYEDLIPRSKGVRSVSAALNDGEDFELLFTISKDEGARLLDKAPGLLKA